MSGLLQYLQSRTSDRGFMADLRCALIEGKRYRAWPGLASFGGVGDDWRALTVQTVAGLYATHPRDTKSGDFGATCRQLVSDDERKSLSEVRETGPLARRFQHLLAAEREEIFERVIRLALRAKSEEVSVNYESLYDDLTKWGYYPQAVRVRWAKSFWAPRADEEVT